MVAIVAVMVVVVVVAARPGTMPLDSLHGISFLHFLFRLFLHILDFLRNPRKGSSSRSRELLPKVEETK